MKSTKQKERTAGSSAQRSEQVREFLTMDEAAGRLKLSKKTLYAWVVQKRLPYYKIGTAKKAPLRFLASDIEAILSGNRIASSDEVQRQAAAMVATGGLAI